MRIPTAGNIRRETPNLGTTVSTPDLTPLAKGDQLMGQGIQNLGKGISILGKEIEKQQLADDTFEYGIARSKALQDSITLQDQLKNTQDYNVIPEQHSKGWNDIKNNALENVKNPRLRQQLSIELDLQAEKDRISSNNVFIAKRGDSDRSIIDSQLTEIENAIASTTDEGKRGELLISANQIIEGAVVRQSLDKEAAQGVRSKLFEKVAVNRINSLPAEEQLKVLGVNKAKNGEITFSKTGTFADNLKPETKLAVYQQTQQAAKQRQDDYLANIKKQDFLTQRNAEENSINVILQGGTVSDIPIDQYARLNDAQRANLDTIRQRQNGLPQLDPVEGITAYNDYARQYANDPTAFARVDPIKIRSSVSPDKVDEVMGWQNAALQGIPQNADESNFQQTADYYAKNVLGKKLTSSDAALFTKKLRETRKEFITSKGRQPTNEELKYIANGLVSDALVGGTLWGTNKEPLYKLKDDFEVPADQSDRIITRIKKLKGKKSNPTPDEIREIYKKELSKKTITDISYIDKAVDFFNPISEAMASDNPSPEGLLSPDKKAVTMDEARQYVLERYKEEFPYYVPEGQELDDLAKQAINKNLI
jgi:hypothetical protein